MILYVRGVLMVLILIVAKKIEDLLRAKNFILTHLGLSKDGHPKHPLYISYKINPIIWLET